MLPLHTLKAIINLVRSWHVQEFATSVSEEKGSVLKSSVAIGHLDETQVDIYTVQMYTAKCTLPLILIGQVSRTDRLIMHS